ncbi:phospholipid scramblase-related protein [Actinomadura madurae]|uniref:phospholipid scramblase-related protein n=1 Tax=Actinomadura madurae TaxID=1993 RepID=UPI000D86895E|nr:phospholipid scramblase-related protein [Actinomadura madurae]SPT64547.1 Scramblase [Actinomadura madurae]
MSDLFSSPVLRVDQPRGAPAARSRYRVYDGHGTLLATGEERDVSLARQTVRTAFGGSDAARTVHVENGQGTPLLTVEKQNARSTRVSTPDGHLYGSLRNVRLYEYALLDAAERQVGGLDGNRTGRKFRVLDGYGNHVARIDKKWKGAATELLTTADRYSVEIFQPLPDPLRVLVVAAPLAIDLMLYEGKDWPVG